MTAVFLYEIAERHRRPVTRQDRAEYHAIASAIGRILPGDLGKRVWSVDGTIQVENDDQRAKRLRVTGADMLRRFGPPPSQR